MTPPVLPSFNALLRSIEHPHSSVPPPHPHPHPHPYQHQYPSYPQAQPLPPYHPTDSPVRPSSTHPPPPSTTLPNTRPRSATAPSISRHIPVRNYSNYPGVPTHSPASFEHYCDRVKELRGSRECWYDDVAPTVVHVTRPLSHERTNSSRSLPPRLQPLHPRPEYQASTTSQSPRSITSLSSPVTPQHSSYFESRGTPIHSPSIAGKNQYPNLGNGGNGKRVDGGVTGLGLVTSGRAAQGIQIPMLPVMTKDTNNRRRRVSERR